MKRALITGITGQDGGYLAEALLEDGWEVHGLMRRLSAPNDWRIRHLRDRIHLHSGDMLDQGCLIRLLSAVRPAEVYNLAAQSFVAASWDQPLLTGAVTGLGAARLLEAIRQVDPSIRVYQASSSEMYGIAEIVPQNEDTPFHPRSPYAAAKVYAHHMTVNYRESFDMFAVSGILFNHESPRRGEEFVTRKITKSVAEIVTGQREKLQLGNMSARRDWGYAGDYVLAMIAMLRQDTPEDFVVASGISYSVEDFCRKSFEAAGLDFRDHVEIDPGLIRPADIPELRGDYSRAQQRLGWTPEVDLDQLIQMMVDSDLERARGSRD
jgi:GDPmannose 4,6-dehydratase